jgi:hypothetical protein
MSILSIVICLVIGIIAFVFIAAVFSPSQWSIQAEAIINKSQTEVFNYVKILKNSEHFNKWVMTDPNMKKDFNGTDGNVGFVYSWDSENKSVGKGEQEITKIIEDKVVDYEIRFIKPFEGVSHASISTEALSANQTKIVWIFSSSNTYMMKVLHVVLNLKKVLLKDLQTSLNNLKLILEK